MYHHHVIILVVATAMHNSNLLHAATVARCALGGERLASHLSGCIVEVASTSITSLGGSHGTTPLQQYVVAMSMRVPCNRWHC